MERNIDEDELKYLGFKKGNEDFSYSFVYILEMDSMPGYEITWFYNGTFEPSKKFSNKTTNFEYRRYQVKET